MVVVGGFFVLMVGFLVGCFLGLSIELVWWLDGWLLGVVERLVDG